MKQLLNTLKWPAAITFGLVVVWAVVRLMIEAEGFGFTLVK